MCCASTIGHANNDHRPFYIDVTPPVGGYLCGGLHTEPAIGVETPLFLRGLVLEQEARRYILASVEYCYLCGRSYERMIAALSATSGVSPEQVTLHSVHTHDAPLINEEAHHLVARTVPGVHDEGYFSDVLDRAGKALNRALAEPGVELGGVGFSSTPVYRFASSRRVIDPATGQCRGRWSVCRDGEVRNAPEGLIDPALDQITLFDKQKTPVACLNFYACHPQVSDGRRLWSGDTVGLALNLFEQTWPGVFPVYFTGCAGDITAGKYTTANRPRNRLVFGLRLFDAMDATFHK
jgi:hypothetical protein